MGNAVTRASWVGKAAYELDVLTGRGGSWAFHRANQFAREIGSHGLPLSDFDPRSTMRRLYGTNDNAAAELSCGNQPTNFGGVELEALVLDVSGSNGTFKLLVSNQDRHGLDRPITLNIRHSLANGIRDAISGEDWWLDGVARARPCGELIIVALAKNACGEAAVTLVLTRTEAVELHRLLASSTGRPHWSRFHARGIWNEKKATRRAVRDRAINAA